jgi:ATP-binding cassette subfamily F protein 3
MESEISAVLPSLDPVITEYSVGFLNHASTSTSPDADIELAEAISTVRSILLDAAPPSVSEASITALVEKLARQLDEAHGDERKLASSKAKKLDQTIHMASQRNISSTMGLVGTGIDIDAVGTRKVESKVDKKKLEKAERKIKAKQDKKVMKNVTYEASKLITTDEENYDDFYMQVNPLTLGSGSQGKSKDIKLDRVDVQIGGLRILSDTTLTLAYGRRYGLVGQNGIGKSTLLRALSRREIAIPTHITILHVEQEVGSLLILTL